jgi:hypothetical protein
VVSVLPDEVRHQRVAARGDRVGRGEPVRLRVDRLPVEPDLVGLEPQDRLVRVRRPMSIVGTAAQARTVRARSAGLGPYSVDKARLSLVLNERRRSGQRVRRTRSIIAIRTAFVVSTGASKPNRIARGDAPAAEASTSKP